MKRSRPNQRASRARFNNRARKVHKMNLLSPAARQMRGGIRL